MGLAHLYRILAALAVVECSVLGEDRGDRPVAADTAAGGARVPTADAGSDFRRELAGVLDGSRLSEILSEKVFKVILTSRPRGTFPSAIWRSSHVIYLEEL